MDGPKFGQTIPCREPLRRTKRVAKEEDVLWASLRAVVVLAACAVSRAERLPLTVYSVENGLPSDGVRSIVKDSSGFLWIGHSRFLSRFDGRRFVAYGVEHGLPDGPINDILQTRDGTYLLAARTGILLFKPRGPAPLFMPLDLGPDPPDDVQDLLEDRSGRVWAATDRGLFVLERAGPGFRSARVLLPPHPEPDRWSDSVSRLCEGRDGVLWIGTRKGLVRRTPEGRTFRFLRSHGLPDENVQSLIEDHAGWIWAGTPLGLVRFAPRADPGKGAAPEAVLRAKDMAKPLLGDLLESGDGTLWLSGAFLGEIPPGMRTPESLRWYGTENGLSQSHLTALAEDIAGNLWIGTEAAGLMRLSRDGFVSFGEAEGLLDPRIGSVVETPAGSLCVSTAEFVACLEDGRFESARPQVPGKSLGWGWYQSTFQDREGTWWIPSEKGVCLFRGVHRVEDLATRRPSRILTSGDGLPGDQVFRLFEDAAGDVWISTIDTKGPPPLARWERRTGRVQGFRTSDGLSSSAPTAFREDGQGTLWLGFFNGGVARYRGGRFETFSEKDGCPRGLVRAIHLDRRGALWIATEGGGVARIADPSAGRPRFEARGMASGLSSDLATSIIEDREGRIYIGTDRGLDRLDPRTGAIRHFTRADGLPNAFVNVSHRDRRGRLWFGTLQGLAGFEPHSRSPAPVPRPLLARIAIAGTPLPLSELGEESLGGVVLSSSDNRLRIECSAIDFAPDLDLRFQHRLGETDWSAPTTERAVEYAGLGPGTYRFEARTVTQDGRPGPATATLAFRVLPPVWQRWWFIGCSGALLLLAAFAVHRLRVGRAIALEKVRTRIATDLHDDIGASLSQIAILSEVLGRRPGGADETARDYLSRIADSSRALIDSMNDIVWAINPKRDRLIDVIQRMRSFASEACAARSMKFQLEAPEAGEEVPIGAEVRREVFLVFKEAVINAIKHSGGGCMAVLLASDGRSLRLEVRDDGRGFDPRSPSDGHGMESMRRRAERIGGRLRVESAPGGGTAVTLEVNRGWFRQRARRRRHLNG